MMSTALIAVSSGTAHAGLMQFDDGFEYQPHTTWESDSAGDRSAGFETNNGTARTGANNGWLKGQYGGASEKIWVYTGGVPSVAGAGCAAQIHVRPHIRATLVLEIWTLQGGKRYSVERVIDGSGYQPVYTGRWPLYGDSRVQFRIVMHGNGDGGLNWVRLDDLVLQCTW